jgi:hypothetical protein
MDVSRHIEDAVRPPRHGLLRGSAQAALVLLGLLEFSGAGALPLTRTPKGEFRTSRWRVEVIQTFELRPEREPGYDFGGHTQETR